MYKVGINFDEISDNLVTALRVMRGCAVQYGELRTVEGKNFVFWTDNEVKEFKIAIEEAGIQLIAAATPLFKWYDHPNADEIKHDSFGFNPRIDDNDKRQIIDRALSIAAELGIPRLRIFSGLGKIDDAGQTFADDHMLAYALKQADRFDIDLYLENEPVCRVYTKAGIVDLLNHQKHPRLKLWLDIANMLEVHEAIDAEFLKTVSSRLGYVHVKDFVHEGDKLMYVPTGDGEIPYAQILSYIDDLGLEDIIFTVETHAKSHKVEASVRSILATQQLVHSLSDRTTHHE